MVFASNFSSRATSFQGFSHRTSLALNMEVVRLWQVKLYMQAPSDLSKGEQGIAQVRSALIR